MIIALLDSRFALAREITVISEEGTHWRRLDAERSI